jgi:hypothetical protein
MPLNLTVKQIWTNYLINGSLTITKDFYFLEVSIVLVSGTGTYSGSASANGIPSQPINLTIGQPVTVSSGSSCVLDGLILTTTGTIQILGR